MNLTNIAQWIGRFVLAIACGLAMLFLSRYLMYTAGFEYLLANGYAVIAAIVIFSWVMSS